MLSAKVFKHMSFALFAFVFKTKFICRYSLLTHTQIRTSHVEFTQISKSLSVRRLSRNLLEITNRRLCCHRINGSCYVLTSDTYEQQMPHGRTFCIPPVSCSEPTFPRIASHHFPTDHMSQPAESHHRPFSETSHRRRAGRSSDR